MTKSEAENLIETVRQLWPSKFQWNPETVDLWAENFARRDWNFDQCYAVIRDERTRDDGKSAPMARLAARCHEVHRPPRRAIANPSHATEITPAEWAVIHRDRDDAAAWWFQNREDAEAIVAQAIAAYPMFAAQFKRFTVEGFKPKPNQCMSLRCAWTEFQQNGARPKPAHVPGVMARAVAVA